MADYRVADIEKLESDLTGVADEVRTLADTTSKMSLEVMKGNIAEANDKVDSQSAIIAQIKRTLQGKAGSGDPNSKALFYYEDYDEEGYPHTLVITQSIPSNTIENGRTIPKLFATHYYGCLSINARINKVVLPDDVTVLDNTLMISYEINEVEGWNNLVYIGDNCFYSCKILKTISEFPPNLTWLGTQAFNSCAVREDLPTLPDGIINIGKSCFVYSWSSENIVAFKKLPNSLITIGNDAFRNNGFGLFPETVYIPESVKTIGDNAFRGAICNTKTIVFRGTPESIGATSFDDIKKTTGIRHIYCPWSDGEVANQPWGATNATIHFNTQYDADGNPIIEEG